MNQPEHNDILDALFKVMFTFKKTMRQNFSLLSSSLNMMHLRVLRIIDFRGQCMPLDISKELKRDKAQITRLLKELIDQQLIEKSVNPSDKRSSLLSLTAKGSAALQDLLQAEEQTILAFTQEISSSEQAQFVALVDKMTRSLNINLPVEFSRDRFHR